MNDEDIVTIRVKKCDLREILLGSHAFEQLVSASHRSPHDLDTRHLLLVGLWRAQELVPDEIADMVTLDRVNTEWGKYFRELVEESKEYTQ